jgi:beta-N-acetylhexosaminidase
MSAQAIFRRMKAGILLASLALLVGCSTATVGQTGRGLNGVSVVFSTPSPGTADFSGTGVTRLGMQIRHTVDKILKGMTLDEKLGQMMLIETTYTGYTQDVDNMVAGMHAGAMIVYKQNIKDTQQLHDYLATIKAHAHLPMIISMDEEGGGVDRLGDLNLAPPLPSAQSLAATGNPQAAYDAGVTAAKEMLALGINTNLAPVVDVRGSPYSIEWTRLFGSNPKTVDKYAGAFLDGLQSNGVIGCLKHWPGIGSITEDPHQTLPTMPRSLSQLQSSDFVAFEGLLDDDPGMIMVTHVIVPELDPKLPATLSPAVVQRTLRDKLGYQGVVMTDSLYMKGISNQYSLPQAAVLSVLAGDDLLEGAYDTYSMRGMVQALKNAVKSGKITEERIDESVRRILTLKVLYGVIPMDGPYHFPGDVIGSVAGPQTPADLPRGV